MLRWTGVGLSAVLAPMVLAAIPLYFVGESRLSRTYDIPAEAIPIPSDEASVARGRHLARAVTLCAACHGEDLQGDLLFEAPLIARVYASNLTAGRGGVGGTYEDADWMRAIRHGVARDGRGLMIMHSDAYQNLGAEDLAAIIAYVKSVPAVDNELPATRSAPLGRILVALGLFDTESMPLIPAEVIDHAAPFRETPPPGVDAEYGGYLVSIALCTMCHGGDLTGGPPIEEGAPPAPNLIVYGAPNGWSEEQFLSTIRSGVTPDGRTLDGEAMPWEVYARMTDDELRAIRAYLLSLVAG